MQMKKGFWRMCLFLGITGEKINIDMRNETRCNRAPAGGVEKTKAIGPTAKTGRYGETKS